MAEIKIDQKLSKQQLIDMQAQYKNGVVHILSELPVEGKVMSDVIVAKADCILFLHSKLVVRAKLPDTLKGRKLRVGKLSDGFAIYPL